MEENKPAAEEAYYGLMEKYDDIPKLVTPLRHPPIRKIVEARIAEHEEILKKLKEFLTALNENPGVEKVMDLSRKIGL